MKSYLTLRVLVSISVILISCSNQTSYTTPEEVLSTYIGLLAENNISEASALRVSPSHDFTLVKETLGGALVLALMFVVIKLTGLNPFATLLSCALIEKFVSPENRKYVFIAVISMVVLSTLAFYKLMIGLPLRIACEIDKRVVEGMEEVKILESEIRGNSATVRYTIHYKNDESVDRSALLVLTSDGWRIKRL